MSVQISNGTPGLPPRFAPTVLDNPVCRTYVARDQTYVARDKTEVTHGLTYVAHGQTEVARDQT